MTSLAMQRDELMPRRPGGMGPGLLLALVVHLGLVVALAIAVHWHASEPEGVEAELWAAVPQVAAPRAVEPEPTPTPTPTPPTPPTPTRPTPTPRVEPQPDAQIAIERAKREAQERKKKEQAEQLAAKQKLEQDALRKKQADEARLAAQREAQREANLKRMMGQAGASGDASSTSAAAQSAGPSAGYAGRIKARIKPNIVLTEAISGNPLAEIELRLAPDGTIIGKKLVRSSGVAEWDEAVQRAIDRTEVLPRDIDGRVPPTMVIAFKPRD